MKPTKFLIWFYTQTKIIESFLILSLILFIAFIDYLTPQEMSVRLLTTLFLFFYLSGVEKSALLVFSFLSFAQ